MSDVIRQLAETKRFPHRFAFSWLIAGVDLIAEKAAYIFEIVDEPMRACSSDDRQLDIEASNDT